MESTELQKHNGGTVQTVRQEFGATEFQKQFETAAVAVAARERAAIEARYVMALQRPRNIEQFRQQLKQDCIRPGFAAVARYSKPMGNTSIEGPSIRFVETALRHYRNILPEVTTVYDDANLRICRVVVADLESNIAYATEVQVQKTVERRGYEDKRTGKVAPPKGRTVIGERLNSYGDPVFLVEATDDEVISKQNALVSKAIRTQALRLLPGDIVDEMQQIIIETNSKEIVDDPIAARRKISDAFAAMKIEAEDLADWAGKPLEKLTAKEWGELRQIGMAIKEGETTWADVMQARNPVGTAEAAQNVAAEKLARMRGGQTKQSGSTPEAASTLAGTSEPEKGERAPVSNPKPVDGQAEERPLTEAEMKAAEEAVLKSEQAGQSSAGQSRIQFPKGRR